MRKAATFVLALLLVMSLASVPKVSAEEQQIVGVWMWPSTYRAYYQEALEQFGYKDPFDKSVYPTIPDDVKEKALKIAAEKLVSELKKAGVTDIFLEVKLTTGYLVYPSHVYPGRTYPAYPYNTTNILIPLLKEAHQNGIRVHAWIVVHYDKNFFGKIDPIWHVGKAKSNWTSYPVKGRVRLANTKYLGVLENIIKELISMGFDGIHLDYIRYPHMVYSFSPKDIERAEKAGINVTKVMFAVRHTFYNDVPLPNGSTAGPKDPYYIFKLYIKGDPDIVKWFELRRKDVDSYVGNITELVHSLKTWDGKTPIVSAALMPDWTRNNILYPEEFQLLHYGQVWSDFVKLGVDWLIPMAYYKDYGEPVSWVGTVRGHVVEVTKEKSVPLVGIQAYGVPLEKIIAEKEYALSELGDKEALLVILPAEKPKLATEARDVIKALSLINKGLYAGEFYGYMLTEDIKVSGTDVPRGSIILVGDKEEINAVKAEIQKLKVSEVFLRQLPDVNVIPLLPPKIALLDVGHSYTINDVLKELGFKYDLISNESIKAGELSKYDLLILPPGSGTWEAKLLGKDGAEKLAEFLAGGGGLIGVCAGGYAVIKGYNEPTSKVQLVDAELKNWPNWWLGVGIVHVQVTNESNPVVFGFKDGFDAIYWNGPVFKPYDLGKDTPLGIDVAPYVELIKYVSTDHKEGAFSYGWGDFNQSYVDGILKDSAAVIYSKYGHGKIVLFSFHPELTSGDLDYAPNSVLDSNYNYRLWFNAIYFVSRKGKEMPLKPAKGIVYFRWGTIKPRLESPDVGIKTKEKGAVLLVTLTNYGNIDAENITLTLIIGKENMKTSLKVEIPILKTHETKVVRFVLNKAILPSIVGVGKNIITIEVTVTAENENKLNAENNEFTGTFEVMVMDNVAYFISN
ncbi:putative glycoside hydrolase [Thermococcus barophilus]|uniref:Glycosyl hydrolase n=1 Tax=Thermococcus barophilus TaxID=55802 RepID=A0A0S1X9L7_THEBA|nr:putative glycoside hydrolase [Thermococcus barophilus]ALM74490.1 Glycosyl hydrolase [Thermococcus barophilus]